MHGSSLGSRLGEELRTSFPCEEFHVSVFPFMFKNPKMIKIPKSDFQSTDTDFDGEISRMAKSLIF